LLARLCLALVRDRVQAGVHELAAGVPILHAERRAEVGLGPEDDPGGRLTMSRQLGLDLRTDGRGGMRRSARGGDLAGECQAEDDGGYEPANDTTRHWSASPHGPNVFDGLRVVLARRMCAPDAHALVRVRTEGAALS
jgi:hypothetical protein